MAKFTVRDPYGKLSEFQITGPEVKIGRGNQSDLVLPDGKVSRLHAILRLRDDKYVIEDQQSVNGLFVNGVCVKEKELVNDDVITMGDCVLTFKDTPQIVPAISYNEMPLGGTVFLKNADEVLQPMGTRVLSPQALPQQTPSQLIQEELMILRKKSQILTLLYDLGKALSTVFSIEDIYKKVSDLLFQVCATDRVVILVSDEKTGELVPAHVAFRHGAPSETLKRLSISRTITNKVINERASLLTLNALTDPSLASSHSIILQQLHSVMCAPLIGQQGILGLIYLDQPKVAAFTTDDLDLLTAVAAQAAIALDNARTHEKLQRDAEAKLTYQRFLPAHVVEEILQSPQSLKLGGVNQTVTMLFADIRGFTTMSETMEPEQVVAILNQYFSAMTDVIFDHHGTLDKYIGDGIMALFGAPYEGPDDAANAVHAAIEMQQRMKAIKRDLRLPDGRQVDFNIGIGINTGVVTVGYIGSERRTDYTAIGDPVNLAARLESGAAKGQIIISKSTYELVKDKFEIRPLGPLQVKGKREPVERYEVVWDSQENTL